MTLNYEEIMRRFQGLVQGNIDLMKTKKQTQRIFNKNKNDHESKPNN
jgi:hypothetical protein